MYKRLLEAPKRRKSSFFLFGPRGVDFILYGNKQLIAIEVKSSKTVHPSDLRSLQIFKEEYPIAKLFLFYGGKESFHRGDIEVLPIAEILPKLPEFLKRFT